jgi:hypothetical protein
VFAPCLLQYQRVDGGDSLRLSQRLVDDYLEPDTARGRPNTVLATAFDLKVYFDVVAKDPEQVGVDDVLGYSAARYAWAAATYPPGAKQPLTTLGVAGCCRCRRGGARTGGAPGLLNDLGRRGHSRHLRGPDRSHRGGRPLRHRQS